MKKTARQKRIEVGLALVNELNSAAQAWGWESDQGFGSAATRACTRHAKALAAMEKFLEENIK